MLEARDLWRSALFHRYYVYNFIVNNFIAVAAEVIFETVIAGVFDLVVVVVEAYLLATPV